MSRCCPTQLCRSTRVASACLSLRGVRATVLQPTYPRAIMHDDRDAEFEDFSATGYAFRMLAVLLGLIVLGVLVAIVVRPIVGLLILVVGGTLGRRYLLSRVGGPTSAEPLNLACPQCRSLQTEIVAVEDSAQIERLCNACGHRWEQSTRPNETEVALSESDQEQTGLSPWQKIVLFYLYGFVFGMGPLTVAVIGRSIELGDDVTPLECLMMALRLGAHWTVFFPPLVVLVLRVDVSEASLESVRHALRKPVRMRARDWLLMLFAFCCSLFVSVSLRFAA